MGYEATGKIHSIDATKEVSEKFRKREFVVELADNPKYPQVVLFQITGDRIAQLDDLAVGDRVRIEFSLRGREWKSPKGEVRYFNGLDVWKVERMGERRQTARGGKQETSPQSQGSFVDAPPIDDSDIPFASSAMRADPNPIAKVLR